MKGNGLADAVKRFLSIYRKGSDRPETEEIDLSNVPLHILQGVFGESETELMYAVYVVEPRHAKALQPYISEPLDIQKFDYFLEAVKIK